MEKEKQLILMLYFDILGSFLVGLLTIFFSPPYEEYLVFKEYTGIPFDIIHNNRIIIGLLFILLSLILSFVGYIIKKENTLKKTQLLEMN